MTNPEITNQNEKVPNSDRRNLTTAYENDNPDFVARAYASGEPNKYSSPEFETKVRTVETTDFSKPVITEKTTTVLETVTETHYNSSKPPIEKRNSSDRRHFETSSNRYDSLQSRQSDKNGASKQSPTGQKIRSTVQESNYTSREREAEASALLAAQASAKNAELELQSALLEQKK